MRTPGRASINRDRDNALWRATLGAIAERPQSAVQIAKTLDITWACAAMRLRRAYQFGLLYRTSDYSSTHRYAITDAGAALLADPAHISLRSARPPAGVVSEESAVDNGWTSLHSALGMGEAPARLTGRIVKPMEQRKAPA